MEWEWRVEAWYVLWRTLRRPPRTGSLTFPAAGIDYDICTQNTDINYAWQAGSSSLGSRCSFYRNTNTTYYWLVYCIGRVGRVQRSYLRAVRCTITIKVVVLLRRSPESWDRIYKLIFPKIEASEGAEHLIPELVALCLVRNISLPPNILFIELTQNRLHLETGLRARICKRAP
jgi:hypothetical protein